jgi:exosortase A
MTNFLTGKITGLFTLILIIPLIFFNTTEGMVNVWMVNETFTHGFLIFPITLWLIWQKKVQLFELAVKPEPRLFLLLILILSAWFVSFVVDVQVVQQLCMIALIPVTIWLLYGRQVVLRLLFPLLYLFFAVPLGQGLIPPLMEFTADFTVFFIKLSGIPIYRDGLAFSLPSGNWSVVEECSGVRYLIASMALGTIYAYTSYQSTMKRTVFILASIIVPILANGFRAYGIVMIGHFSGMELAVGADHLVYGWAFFGVVIFLMFYAGSFWWDPVEKLSDEKGKVESLAGENREKSFMPLAISTIVLMLSATLFAHQITDPTRVVSSSELSLPDNFEAWQHDENLALNWRPIYENPDDALNRSYRFGKDFVQLDIGYFAYQRRDSEAISTQNRLTDPYGGEWKVIFSSDLQQDDLFVKETEIKRINRKILIWSWYKIGDYQTPNAYIAKVYEAYNKIFMGRQDAALISLATTFDYEKESSRKILMDFWKTSGEEIIRRIEDIQKNH